MPIAGWCCRPGAMPSATTARSSRSPITPTPRRSARCRSPNCLSTRCPISTPAAIASRIGWRASPSVNLAGYRQRPPARSRRSATGSTEHVDYLKRRQRQPDLGLRYVLTARRGVPRLRPSGDHLLPRARHSGPLRLRLWLAIGAAGFPRRIRGMARRPLVSVRRHPHGAARWADPHRYRSRRRRYRVLDLLWPGDDAGNGRSPSLREGDTSAPWTTTGGERRYHLNPTLAIAAVMRASRIALSAR